MLWQNAQGSVCVCVCGCVCTHADASLIEEVRMVSRGVVWIGSSQLRDFLREKVL